jgi:hypothetical protein
VLICDQCLKEEMAPGAHCRACARKALFAGLRGSHDPGAVSKRTLAVVKWGWRALVAIWLFGVVGVVLG